MKVAGGRVFAAITAGDQHTCALDTAGKAWCWGWDEHGQVGDGSTSQANKYSPVKVAEDRAYTAITAGGRHTCALDTAGKAWCWGRDVDGEAGDGTTSQADKYSPVPVAGGRAYTTITAGVDHTCALDTAGKAWCWGADNSGEVGDGSASQADKYSPVKVAGGPSLYERSPRACAHTCALDTAGKAWCWGNDNFGQVGDGSASQAAKYSPVAVDADDSPEAFALAAITAGDFHTCALDTAGKAWCWGLDENGQVGDGSASQANKYKPVKVAGGKVWRLPARTNPVS